MQVVICGRPQSESHLLDSSWPVCRRCSSLKRQGRSREGQSQGWDCLFNVFKTIGVYFHLIKTVKFYFRFMEFNNYN